MIPLDQWLLCCLPFVVMLVVVFLLRDSGRPLEADCEDPQCKLRCRTCGEHHNWRILPKAVYDWQSEQEGSDA